VCGKTNCHSTKHPKEEAEKAMQKHYTKIKARRGGQKARSARAFLNWELNNGETSEYSDDELEDGAQAVKQLMAETLNPPPPLSLPGYSAPSIYLIGSGSTTNSPAPPASLQPPATRSSSAAPRGRSPQPTDDNRIVPYGHTNVATAQSQASTFLTMQDQAFLHGIRPPADPPVPFDAALLQKQPAFYGDSHFYGILIDTGAAFFSTVGIGQVRALQKTIPTSINFTTAGKVNIVFGQEQAKGNIGSIQVETPIGLITFYVLETSTPCIMSLHDLTELGCFYNNLADHIVQFCENKMTTFPVTKSNGHVFFLRGPFLPPTATTAISECLMTETKLRRLHRRFGHPAAERLLTVLSRAGYDDIDRGIAERINQ
jgi:hypothetical protein